MIKYVHFLLSVLKEFLGFFFVDFFRSRKVSRECLTVMEDGLCVIPNFYSAQLCEELRIKVDSLLQDKDINVWKDDLGADKRVYFSESVCPDLKTFYYDPKIRNILKEYLGCIDPQGFVMAARIDAVSGNTGSGGGWHRDSPYSRQFKAILYLSDVGKKNGPFEYLPKTHTRLSSVKSWVSGIIKPGQYRYSSKQIDLLKQKFKVDSKKVVAAKGSLVLVDTKGVHRGCPIELGTRYALFCYFWDKQIPSGFEIYRQ